LPEATVNGIFFGCTFDMCGLEGEPNQNEFRCQAYQKLTDACLDYAGKNDIKDWVFNWRESVNCRESTKYYKYSNIS
jgi:hypothetical protein